MGIGVWQLGLLLAIIIIVFGVGKLPNVMGDIGKGISNLKKGLNEDDDTNKNVTKNDKKDDTSNK